MTNSIHSTIISKLPKLEEKHSVVPAGYVMVNVRPGETVAAMINVLCDLSGMTPSALVSDEIPHKLVAEALLETNSGAVNEAAHKAAEDAEKASQGLLEPNSGALPRRMVPNSKVVFPEFVHCFQEGSALYILSNEMEVFRIPITSFYPVVDDEGRVIGIE